MKELKPCPFCGGKAKLHTMKDYHGTVIVAYVSCIVCGGCGGRFSGIDTAIRVWNRRS